MWQRDRKKKGEKKKYLLGPDVTERQKQPDTHVVK
jgi:hypothetical protein